jgi:hypothetical protein
MKKILLTLTLISLVIILNAQGKPEYNTVIKGTITDSSTSKAVEFANVGIYKMPGDSLVAGSLSDAKGNFIKEGLPYGTYKIKITFIGYNDVVINNVTIDKKQPKYNAEKIVISPSASELNAVTIEGVRKPFEQTFDKKIFLMDDKRAPGALNVLDQLKTLPSVTVDPEGNVKYRGQTPNILVDDQPYTILYPKLEMIPAANVDKIEFIEPSSRYASSVGTINIKLKQPKENGLSGAIYAGCGTTDFKSINQNYDGLNLNYKYKKLILYGNVNYYFFKGVSKYKSEGSMLFDDKLYNFDSHGEYDFYSSNLSAGTGAIYNFDKKRKLTFSYTPSFRSDNSEQTYIYNETLNGAYREKDSSYSTSERPNDGNTFSLDYRKKFENEQKELSIKTNYSIQNSGNLSLQDKMFSYYEFLPKDSIRKSRNDAPTDKNRFSFETNLKNPIDTTGRWEAGVQAKVNKGLYTTNYFINYERMPEFCNVQKVIDMDYALYGNIGKKWKKFKFDGGMRMLLKTIDADVTLYPDGKDSLIEISRVYPGIEPNGSIGYEIKPFHELKLNYTMDQQIPDLWQLNPYVDKTDPRNWDSGNPDLKPSLYHRFSFGYMWAPGAYSISVDAFTFFSNNYIEYVKRPLDDYTSYSKPENIGKSTGTGITISGSAMPAAWFNTNASCDVYKSSINATNLENTTTSVQLTNTGLNTNNWTAMGNCYMTFTIKKKNNISVYLNYMGRDATLGGYSKGSLYNGLYLSRRFLDNKLNVYFVVQNVVDKWSKWTTTQEYFGRKETNEYSGTWNKRSFRIYVRYSFNKGDRGLLKTEEGGGGGAPGGK